MKLFRRLLQLECHFSVYFVSSLYFNKEVDHDSDRDDVDTTGRGSSAERRWEGNPRPSSTREIQPQNPRSKRQHPTVISPSTHHEVMNEEDTAVVDQGAADANDDVGYANNGVGYAAVASAPRQESEKERLARLLREERQKSAAAQDRKRSEKSKKHDRWLRKRETERTRRATFW